MPTQTYRLHHRLFRHFSTKYDLKYRAAVESAKWDSLGYNYRELWRHHSLFIETTGSVYIAVSKSANSAIRRALTNTNFAQAFDRKRNKAHGVRQLPAIQQTLEDLANGTIPCFTLVRHPVERFWSAYQDKIIQHPEHGLADRVLAFHSLTGRPNTTLSPEMLLDYIEQTPTHELDEHVRPQWACCGYERIPFQLIAKVEHLEQDLQRAVEMGLFPEKALKRLPHSNRSKPSIEDKTKRQLEARIRTCYSRDTEAFGYRT